MAGDDETPIHGVVLDGRGGARQVPSESIRAWQPEQGPLWVHLDRGDPEAHAWLTRESGLDHLVAAALLAEETRPRCSVVPGGLLVILRGVNLNPGADPEDMVALRAWVGEGRMITVRRRNLMAVEDVRNSLVAGLGPKSVSRLLVALTERLTERMAPVVEQLDEELDALEVEALDGGSEVLRPRLADLRRQAIALRRHIGPQRDALLSLGGLSTALISDEERMHFREVGDRITRYVEDLDAVRERAAVTNDELSTRMAESMNRGMYILSLVTAVFLPLGLLTGLLGINVGGLPGSNNEWGFWIVTLLLVVLGAAMVWVLRVRKLF